MKNKNKKNLGQVREYVNYVFNETCYHGLMVDTKEMLANLVGFQNGLSLGFICTDQVVLIDVNLKLIKKYKSVSYDDNSRYGFKGKLVSANSFSDFKIK